MKTSGDRRVWATVLAACFLAACTSSSEPSSGVPVGADSAGYGPFEPLAGVATVVEATVIAHRGPVAVADEFGAVSYQGRSEDADEWTTPFGMPVVVLGDLELVDFIGGTEEADALIAIVEAAATSDGSIDVLAPVGVYDEAQRYQLWLKPSSETRATTYLGFDRDGEPVDGLGLRGADEAFERLAVHTGRGEGASLMALAREVQTAADGGPRGELTEFVAWPDHTTEQSTEQAADQYAAASEEQSADASRVLLYVAIAGATPGEFYGLRGSQVLGWSDTGVDGQTAVSGWAPVGEEMELVHRAHMEGPIEVVPGASILTVDAGPDELLAFYDLDDDGRVTLRSGLSLAELDTLERAATGLPPETGG